MTAFLVSADLAQAADYTAIAVAELVPPAAIGAEQTYRVRHLERMRGVSYVDVALRLRDLVAAVRQPAAEQAPRPFCTLVYDRTGIGAAVGDVLDRAGIDAELVGITLHGGDTVSVAPGGYRIPKRDAVTALVVGFQNGRVRIAADLALAPILTAELVNFKLTFSAATAHDQYAAWRENDHDDLVLSVALAVWMGERMSETPAVAAVPLHRASPWGDTVRGGRSVWTGR